MESNANNNWPQWVNKETIFYVDYEKRDVFECKVVSVIDTKAVSVEPATHKSDNMPDVVTIEDIGKNFFWVLQNALGVLGFYREKNHEEG